MGWGGPTPTATPPLATSTPSAQGSISPPHPLCAGIHRAAALPHPRPRRAGGPGAKDRGQPHHGRKAHAGPSAVPVHTRGPCARGGWVATCSTCTPPRGMCTRWVAAGTVLGTLQYLYTPQGMDPRGGWLLAPVEGAGRQWEVGGGGGAVGACASDTLWGMYAGGGWVVAVWFGCSVEIDWWVLVIGLPTDPGHVHEVGQAEGRRLLARALHGASPSPAAPTPSFLARRCTSARTPCNS